MTGAPVGPGRRGREPASRPAVGRSPGPGENQVAAGTRTSTAPSALGCRTSRRTPLRPTVRDTRRKSPDGRCGHHVGVGVRRGGVPAGRAWGKADRERPDKRLQDRRRVRRLDHVDRACPVEIRIRALQAAVSPTPGVPGRGRARDRSTAGQPQARAAPCPTPTSMSATDLPPRSLRGQLPRTRPPGTAPAPPTTDHPALTAEAFWVYWRTLV